MLGRLCPSTQEDSTSMSRKAQTSYLWCRGATFRLVDYAPTETPLHLEARQGSCSIKHCCSHMAEMNTESKIVGTPSHLSWNAGNTPDFAYSRMWEVWSNHRSKSWKPWTMTKNTKKTKRNKKTRSSSELAHKMCESPQKNNRRHCRGEESTSVMSKNTGMHVRIPTGNVCKFQFFCAWELELGGAGILLVGSWADEDIEVQLIFDSFLLLKLIIVKVIFTFLSVYAPQGKFLSSTAIRCCQSVSHRDNHPRWWLELSTVPMAGMTSATVTWEMRNFWNG